jgi:hypothetical protein
VRRGNRFFLVELTTIGGGGGTVDDVTFPVALRNDRTVNTTVLLHE